MPVGLDQKEYLFVITVGTTAVENPHIGAVPGKPKQTVLRSRIEAFLRDKSERADEFGPVEELVKWHCDYWQAKENPLDRTRIRQTAAELTSTKIILDMFKERRDIRFSNFVLLSSDTAKGRLCGRVLEQVLIAVPILEANAGQVHRKIVPQLGKRIVNVADELPRLLAEFRSPKDIVVFNITGGYKATAAIIGALAPDQRYWMTYVHEDTEVPEFLNERGQIAPRPTGSSFKVV